jgi:hypothetical protein
MVVKVEKCNEVCRVCGKLALVVFSAIVLARQGNIYVNYVALQHGLAILGLLCSKCALTVVSSTLEQTVDFRP